MFAAVNPPFSSPTRQRLQPQSHQCSLATIHPSKQTNPLHFCLPTTQLSLVPINHLFAHKFILLYGPQISKQRFLKCVTSHFRLRAVKPFVIFAISKCLNFIVIPPHFGTLYAPIFMRNIYPQKLRTAGGWVIMRVILRFVVNPQVVKGHRASFNVDTDTLVPIIRQFNLSQNRKITLPYTQPDLNQMNEIRRCAD